MIDDDMPEQFNETTPSVSKQVDLLVSIGSGALKPSLAPALTHRAPTFSAMDQLVAIPFHINGAEVTASDNPLIDLMGADETHNRVENHNTYYIDRCNLMTGTNRMLVYGKATKPSAANPAVYGELSALPTIRKQTADIQFSLTSIRESTEAHAEAQALATYMTNIANTSGWSTTTDPTLKSYYLDFIRMGSEGAGLMSGAAVNIKAFVDSCLIIADTCLIVCGKSKLCKLFCQKSGIGIYYVSKKNFRTDGNVFNYHKSSESK